GCAGRNRLMGSLARSVELVIRARDESKRVLDNARTQLDRFAAAQARTAARREFLDSQKQAIRGAADAYQEAATAAANLGQKLASAKRPSAALREQFQQARDAARQAKQEVIALGSAYLQTTNKTGGRGSFAAFDAGIASRAAAEAGARRA